MDGIHPIVPPEVGDDSHIVRRLAWALLYQWDRVPEDLRETLIEQAVFTHDRALPPVAEAGASGVMADASSGRTSHQTAQLKEQIGAFVKKHCDAFDAKRT